MSPPSLSSFSLVSSLCGWVTLSPTADGPQSWDRELGCKQLWLQESSFVAQRGEKIAPLQPSGQPRKMLIGTAGITYSLVSYTVQTSSSRPPLLSIMFMQQNRLVGLSQNACLSARYLAIFLLIHTAALQKDVLVRALWVPTGRNPTQISLSQKWNLLLT